MKNKSKNIILLLGLILIVVSIVLLIVFFGKEKTKKEIIGMITTGNVEEPGWNRNHYVGLKSAIKDQNIELHVKENVLENTGACEKAAQELIDEGATMIILGSYNYGDEIRDFIKKHQDISFYSCSMLRSENNLSSYFVRLYQVRYLAGIIAGMQTETNKIGYVAAMSNSEVNRGINAFTLGVQSVNKDAEVCVIWTGSWDNEQSEREATRTLIEDVGVDVITYHQNQGYVIDEAEKFGIYSIGYHEQLSGYSDKYLTAAIEYWDNVYKEIIKEYMQGKANTKDLIWLGLECDAVALAEYSPLVTEDARQEVDEVKEKMLNGWEVFSGKIYAQDGTQKCQDGEAISQDYLLNQMDWLVEGVKIYDK